jgi:large subunit ribosomal protein L23
MRTPYDIIIKPVITENSMMEMNNYEDVRKYTFQVARSANKTEIKKAIEEIFGVTVLNVNTMTVKGKPKRQGRFVGKTATWKKAVVTTSVNDKEIEFFEGM